MSSYQLFILFFVALIIVTLPAIGLYKMFQKAGIAPWKGLVPFYNTWVLLETSKKPKWWFFAQFIPVAGWFFSLLILIEFVKCFGKYKFYQHFATAFFAFAYFIYIGTNKKDRYIGPERVKLYKKSVLREWVDAAVFAIVAATLIRIFVFEAYTIPTPSMEKTLLVNDFLFVSKSAYGPRIPNTPIAMPFVHHTIPGLNIKSYVEWIHIPYVRWFPSPVQRNDVVVFNFPVNDTLINDEENYGSKITYYQAVREMGRDKVWQDFGDIIITRPVDKRENFIKRCVAIAGDTLQVKESTVYINGQPQEVYPQSERYYKVTAPAVATLDKDKLTDFGIYIREDQNDLQPAENGAVLVNITNEEKPNLKIPPGYTVENYIARPDPGLFPYYDTTRQWSADNYGPLWIPKKGVTIDLTPDNVIRYQRCIEVYEENKFENINGKIFINGKEATTYTFKMNYYWMMGDNRHNSLDSRYWGFVPEDHVVGKASLIWFSMGDNGPRWKRIFSAIK
jgi:signal peptidase I